MSNLRPELVDGVPCTRSFSDCYADILRAVSKRRSLIHGRTDSDDGTRHCAIGCAFADSDEPIPTVIVDKVAAYNDSFPRLSRKRRWKRVVAWLRTVVAAYE
jgi:hypothetical protein